MTAERVPHHDRIIAFRHIPVHGYAKVENETVYGIATTRLDELIEGIDALLRELTLAS